MILCFRGNLRNIKFYRKWTNCAIKVNFARYFSLKYISERVGDAPFDATIENMKKETISLVWYALKFWMSGWGWCLQKSFFNRLPNSIGEGKKEPSCNKMVVCDNSRMNYSCRKFTLHKRWKSISQNLMKKFFVINRDWSCIRSKIFEMCFRIDPVGVENTLYKWNVTRGQVRGWTLLMGNTRPECFLRGLKYSD